MKTSWMTAKIVRRELPSPSDKKQFVRRGLPQPVIWQNCRMAKNFSYMQDTENNNIRTLPHFSNATWRWIWSWGDPDLQGDKNNLEKIQRWAALFVMYDHKFDSSVTAMIKILGWEYLEERRRELRLALLYKVVFSFVAVSADDRHWHTYKIRQPNSC